jgi:hypothetical protein
LFHIAIEKPSRQKSIMAMIRLKSDPQGRDSFILYLAPSAIDYHRLRSSESFREQEVYPPCAKREGGTVAAATPQRVA